MKRLPIPDGWRFPIFVTFTVVLIVVVYAIQNGWM